MTPFYWILWAVLGFIAAAVLMWLEQCFSRTKKAGPMTWLAIMAGGPIVWACFLWLTFSAHLQRRRLCALARLDMDGRAAMKKGTN